MTLHKSLSPLLIAASVCAATPALTATDFDPKTEKPIIDLFRESPDAIPLEPRDPSKDLTSIYIDCSTIEGREP